MTEISRSDHLAINRKGWDKVAPLFYGGTALPKYGPLAQTEDDLHLIEPLNGKAVLELGCGSGHSLAYLARAKQAAELWGLDLSPEQLRLAQEYLAGEGLSAQLQCGSMDENPGLPEGHFDLVVSIYSLGWTPDLDRTLARVHSYLKPGGTFLFSWEHPFYRCLTYRPEIDGYVVTPGAYLKEGPEVDPAWRGVEIVLSPRTLSTYLNALTEAGLALEKIVESKLDLAAARPQDYAPDKWYSVPRAECLPTTFIVRARRPG